MVIREYCSVTGRLGSVKIYNSRSEYPFVRNAGGRGGHSILDTFLMTSITVLQILTLSRIED